MSDITLKQNESGKWVPGGKPMRHHSVIIEADTPNEALDRARNYLNEFERFIDHLYGLCSEECSYCKTDREESRQTKGLRTGKRPKRYDAQPSESTP